MRALRCSLISLVALLLVVPALGGQQPQNTPHAGYVYPAGGQQGTTFEVTVGGRFLDGVNRVVFSGPGISAEVVSHDKPLTGQQMTELRDTLQEMLKQGNTPAVQKQIADARMRIGDSQRRNANPVLGELVTLKITIAKDAEPGARQVRLGTPLGLTNPLVFVVGQWPEFREKDEKRGKADAELPITLPAVVNGRIVPGDVDRWQFPLRQAQQYMPGDVDRYRFQARKGQALVIAASARALMPYLADAVPGWFQATLTLFDASGHEVAYDDDYRFQPDPVLHYQVPADGDYVVEIKDALYRGREDFVYRVAIGEVPFITSMFPLGGRAGGKVEVALTGWNLASPGLVMDARHAEPGIYPLSAHSGALSSNRVPFAVDSLPEMFEREPNNSQKEAQPVALPVIVNGRIQQPGDWDVFSFKGRGGDEIVAEVFARRLDSPLDSSLELTDATGRRLAFNDDYEDKGAGLVTHHADSRLTARLPASGTYFLRIGDVQHQGGPEYAYRLRISLPRPDFDLRVTPSDINAVGNGTVPVTVYAIRRDGFTGDIALTLKGAPGDFRLSGGVVPAGADQVRLTLTVGSNVSQQPISLQVEGRATIQGRTVVRQAVAADEMMQAFAYEHLVPADVLRVSVGGRGGTRMPLSVVSSQPVKIPVGGTTRVEVALPPGYRTFENVQFELSEPPEGITLGEPSLDRTGGPVVGAAFGGRFGGPFGAQPTLRGQFLLRADPAKVKPGLRGNLIVTVSGERPPNANQQAQQVRRRVPLATLPAITFEIVTPR
jgi:hypothetical protein